MNRQKKVAVGVIPARFDSNDPVSKTVRSRKKVAAGFIPANFDSNDQASKVTICWKKVEFISVSFHGSDQAVQSGVKPLIYKTLKSIQPVPPRIGGLGGRFRPVPSNFVRLRGLCLLVVGLMLGILVTGCGAGQKKIVDLPKASDKSPAEINGAYTVSAQIPSPKSLEAAAVLKNKGTIVFVQESLVYRGTAAGLVVQEMAVQDEQLRFFEKGSLHLPDEVTDILVIDSVAYVACGPSGIFLVDVSDSSALKPILQIATTGAALRFSRHDKAVVVAMGALGVLIVDVSNPKSPKLKASWQSKGYVRQAIFSPNNENVIYLAEGRAGLTKLWLDSLGAISVGWRFKPGYPVRSVAVLDNAFVVAGGRALTVVHDEPVTKPTTAQTFETKTGSELKSKLAEPQRATASQRQVICNLSFGDLARDLVSIQGSSLAIAGGKKGIILASWNGSNLEISAAYHVEHPIIRVRVNDDKLVAGYEMDGLWIMDLSDSGELVPLYP